MKKSVLLPWDRYMFLMSHASSPRHPDRRVSEDSLLSQKRSCAVGSLDKSNDDRLDADVIRSCFPCSQHAEVTRLLALFNNTASNSVTYSSTGELIIGGRSVRGCHVTDVIDRMLNSNLADAGATVSCFEAKQTNEADVNCDVKSIAKNRNTLNKCRPRQLHGCQQQWVSRWRPLRK